MVRVNIRLGIWGPVHPCMVTSRYYITNRTNVGSATLLQSPTCSGTTPYGLTLADGEARKAAAQPSEPWALDSQR